MKNELKTLKKIAKDNDLKIKDNITVLALKKLLKSKGLLPEEDSEIEYEYINGVKVDKSLSEPVKAAVVAAELQKVAQASLREEEAKKAEEQDLRTYEEKAAQAAKNVAVNPDILSYLGDDDPVKKQVVNNKATRKLRISLVVIDPARQTRNGCIVTSRNRVSGVVKEFVSYEPEPQHLCAITVKTLQETQYNKFVDAYRVDDQGRRVKTKTKTVELAKAFNISILPPLTEEEIEDLKTLQAKQLLTQKM